VVGGGGTFMQAGGMSSNVFKCVHHVHQLIVPAGCCGQGACYLQVRGEAGHGWVKIHNSTLSI
jgi:hypothetical protein